MHLSERERKTTFERNERQLGFWEGHPWYPIITKTHQLISAIDPHYSIDQIKEKYGDLRYYCTPSDYEKYGDQISALTDAAENAVRDLEAFARQQSRAEREKA